MPEPQSRSVIGRRSAAGKSAPLALRRGALITLGTGAAVLSGATSGEPGIGAPLQSRNLAPIQANLGIPVMMSAEGLDAGRWTLNAGLHWASHSLREVNGEQTLEFDGETRRLDLTLALGLGRGFTVSANLPWVAHRGGSLDPLIDGWHGFWGMPDGARDDQPRDRLLYALVGQPGFVLDDEVAGFGDAELAVSWRFYAGNSSDWSLFGQYKFASGDVQDFTGSGDDGYAVGLRYSNGACLWRALSCHLQAGVAAIGDIAFAAAEEELAFAGLTFALSITPAVALIGQLEVQENPYSNGVLETPGTPVWGSLGLRWQPAPGWQLEGQFSEDLNVGAAPDVTFRLALGRAW